LLGLKRSIPWVLESVMVIPQGPLGVRNPVGINMPLSILARAAQRSDAIKALDPAPDKKKEITLLLNLLSELCQQKVAQFSAAIERELRTGGSGENMTIPIRFIMARHKEYRAYIKKDAGKVAGEVAGAIKKFVQGGREKSLTA
jgi:hypothetical protein